MSVRRSPFVERMGCQVDRIEEGRAEVSLDVQEGVHTNLFGVAHGGVMMTMLDVAMAYAARSESLPITDDGPGVVTLEMKSSFMRAGHGPLRAIGTVLHSTASLAFCEGRVLNARNQVCAHATGTFKFVRAIPVSGRSLRTMADGHTDNEQNKDQETP